MAPTHARLSPSMRAIRIGNGQGPALLAREEVEGGLDVSVVSELSEDTA